MINNNHKYSKKVEKMKLIEIEQINSIRYLCFVISIYTPVTHHLHECVFSLMKKIN